MEQFIETASQYLNQYPKTKQLLLVWYKASMNNFQKQLASDYEDGAMVELPDLEGPMIEGIVEASIVVNPRFMYEFFDEQGFKVFLYDKDGKFGYTVNGEDFNNPLPSRIEAEQDAFKKCFEKTENKLKTN